MSNEQFRRAIRGLRPKQIGVLHAIAVTHDEGHHPATLKALEKRGLIEWHTETLPGHPPVIVRRYHMPIHVHIPYCQWLDADADRSLRAEVELNRRHA